MTYCKTHLKDDDCINAAVEFIKEQEGFRDKPYKDAAGNLTIGFGTKLVTHGIHEELPEEMGVDEAGKLVVEHVTNDYVLLKDLIKNHKIKLGISQWVSLLSFIFNVGFTAFKKSKVWNELSEGHWKHAAQEMLRWVKIKKDDGYVECPGLKARREREAELLLEQKLGAVPA